MREIHRILFVRTDRIGDVLMNIPAIHLLRQTFPKSWITALIDESVRDLLRGHPDVDELLAVDAARMKPYYRLVLGLDYRLVGIIFKVKPQKRLSRGK